MDYAAGKYEDFESFSRRIDEAAREREQELRTILQMNETR